jgi:hypothetical protein
MSLSFTHRRGFLTTIDGGASRTGRRRAVGQTQLYTLDYTHSITTLKMDSSDRDRDNIRKESLEPRARGPTRPITMMIELTHRLEAIDTLSYPLLLLSNRQSLLSQF